MDWEKARFNMVEQQIRPWDVLDHDVLDALLEVKREAYVPPAVREMALVDTDLPLGNGKRMWQPKLEARVVQELTLNPTDRVLEIGTGTGYLTALLAHFVKHVYSVEIDAAQAEIALDNLSHNGVTNVTIEQGDAARGWSKHAPYDAIVAGGAYASEPDFLFEQLAEGGRMLAVVGNEPIMTAMLYTRVGGAIRRESLFETLLPMIEGAPESSHFTF